MAKAKIYGGAARQRIDRSVRRSEASVDGAGPAPPPVGSGRNPRTYRRFTLTAQLDAGSSAAVEWDDGTTGTVWDRDTCCYGLAGETGEAAAFATEDGDIEWRVSKNPGQPVYLGTASGTITGTSGNFTTEIDGEVRTVSATIPAAALPSGDSYGSGNQAFLSHSRGTWFVIAFVECAE